MIVTDYTRLRLRKNRMEKALLAAGYVHYQGSEHWPQQMIVHAPSGFHRVDIITTTPWGVYVKYSPVGPDTL